MEFVNSLVINIGKKEIGVCEEGKIKSNYAIYISSSGAHKVVPLNKNNDFNEIVKEAYEKLEIVKSSIMKIILTGNIETINGVQVTRDTELTEKLIELNKGINTEVSITFLDDAKVENLKFKIPENQTFYIVTSGITNHDLAKNNKGNSLYSKIEDIQKDVCNNWPPKPVDGESIEGESLVGGGRRRSRRGRGRRAIRRTRKGNRTKKGLGRVRSSRRGRGRGRRSIRSRRR